MRKKQFSYFSFQNFSGFWVKNFSDFRPKNFKNLLKLTSARPEEQFVTLNIFKNFWTVLDFLQKPLVWFSKIYLSVQSKNCGKNSFFLFFFSEIFRILSKIFSDSWPKNFNNFSKLPSTCPEEQFVAWIFLGFETFRLFCRNIWHGSQIFIYVSRVKTAEEIVFFVFLFRIFSNFEQNTFSLLAKKRQEFVKTTFDVSRGAVCGLKFFFQIFDLFRIFCRNLWHGSPTSIYVSTVKIAEETAFLFFFS